MRVEGRGGGGVGVAGLGVVLATPFQALTQPTDCHLCV